MEEWRTIQGTHYAISNLGNIKNNKTGVVRKPQTDKDGYKQIVIQVNNKHLCLKIHKLVAEYFVPNPLNLPIVNHKDGDKLNCEDTNLEWSTSSHNNLHAYATNLKQGKLSPEDRNKINRMYKTGKYTQRELAKMFGIKQSSVYSIIKARMGVDVDELC